MRSIIVTFSFHFPVFFLVLFVEFKKHKILFNNYISIKSSDKNSIKNSDKK